MGRDEQSDDQDEIPILVCVRHNGTWSWFRSARDFWVLDQQKWANAFASAGHGVDEDYSDRFDIPIVDDQTAESFLQLMSRYKVTKAQLEQDLRTVLPLLQSWFDIAQFAPSLLVDFDERRLYSIHTESPEFENYVPDGWDGRATSFFEVIAVNERYWIIDGEDYVARFITGVSAAPRVASCPRIP